MQHIQIFHTYVYLYEQVWRDVDTTNAVVNSDHGECRTHTHTHVCVCVCVCVSRIHCCDHSVILITIDRVQQAWRGSLRPPAKRSL